MKIVVLLFTALLFVEPANAWEMAGSDPTHTNRIDAGPVAPLKLKWHSSKTRFTTWPITSNSRVFASSGDGQGAWSGSTGEQLWFVTNQSGSEQVAPVISGNEMFIGIPGGSLLRLEAASGEEISKVDLGVPLDVSPVIADGAIFLPSQLGRTLLSVDLDSMQLRWRIDSDLIPETVPAVHAGILVYSTEEIGSSRTELKGLDAATGATRWVVEQQESMSSPSILDDKVVFGGGDLNAYALDLQSGQQVWKSPVEGKFGPRNMPALAFGDVFLADRIGNIYRLDGETGQRKWMFSDTEGAMDQSSPVIAGKTLFIGSSSGDLYAVDVDTGRLMWHDSVRGIVLSGAADSERFYFGVKLGEDEGLYAYEHDPRGSLAETPRSPLTQMMIGLAVFILLLALVVVIARRAKSNPSS